MFSHGPSRPNGKQDVYGLEPVPLIIVEGFLGGAGAVLWGDFQQSLNEGYSGKPRSVIFARVGPVSSLHDRACELYYALRGGTVDYGEDHSRIHRHSRYGRPIASGLYPHWSPQYPLHFLGHSMGGPTITKLQYLLQKDHFGLSDHPDMVLSVSSISAPFRGTQLVYALGECTVAAPAVRALSVGSLLAKWVHLVTFFSPFIPPFLDLHAESRSLSFREISFPAWLKQLWSSDWAESRDATPFDVTFEAADKREENLEGHPHHRTHYRSHVTCISSSLVMDMKSAPLSSLCALPLYFTSRSMASFDFTTLLPIPSFLEHALTYSYPLSLSSLKDEVMELGLVSEAINQEYWANDGVVPLFSQWHPFRCSPTRCRHSSPGKIMVDLQDKPEPGIWHVGEVEEANHISFVPFWRGTLRQKAFWESKGRWLRAIDDTLPGCSGF